MTASNAAAAQQSAIALEQWNTTKAYLPKAQALAERDDARAQRAADLSESDSAFYRKNAKHQMDESAKAEPFQQQVRDTATAYSSGQVGDADAGRANADVEQSFGNAEGEMKRSAARQGLNTGSGTFTGALGDMYTQKALAGAGAQTNARLAARNKAESLVAQAAGSGQTSFSNSIGAGQTASGLVGSGVNLGGTGLTQTNSTQGTYNQGANGAGAGLGSASSNLRANAIESAKTPGFDFVAGLIGGGLKVAGAAAGSPGGMKSLWGG